MVREKESLESMDLAENISVIAERFGNASAFLEDIIQSIDDANKTEKTSDQLDLRLNELKEKYVMQEQRVTHNTATGKDSSQMETISPRIELF